MLCDYDSSIEPVNHSVKSFDRDSPCIWITYPPGAAGDLLTAIIDKHYLRTGCEYLGIDAHGKVVLRTSDYDSVDVALINNGHLQFDQQWFWDFAKQLNQRHLCFSMLDQVIIATHYCAYHQIHHLLDTFANAKIVNIYCKDPDASRIISNMARWKLEHQSPVIESAIHRPATSVLVAHERVLNLQFGCLFDQQIYDRTYRLLCAFLEFPAPLINFEFIQFYLSKQHSTLATQLTNYANTL